MLVHYGYIYLLMPNLLFIIDPEEDAVKMSYGGLW